MRNIKNHKWKCIKGHEIGEDYNSCPLCKLVIDDSNAILNRMNTCASCGQRFNNSPEYYNLYGNYCSMCITRLNQKEEYYLLKERYKKIKKLADKFKLKKMRASILKLWRVDMIEDEKEKDIFYQRINELRKIWRKR